MALEKESGEETFKSRQIHKKRTPPSHPLIKHLQLRLCPERKVHNGREEGAFIPTSSSWRKQWLLCSFLIYELLLLKIPSANRQFGDTGLLFFPAFL